MRFTSESEDGERFTLDTNILVYSVDRGAGTRHSLAIAIVDRAADVGCRLTLQAISEFYAAVTRMGIMPPQRAALLADSWLSIFQCAAGSASAIQTALANSVAGRASYWDALLIASAAEAGCTLILTEDLQNGSRLGTVEIHNPFDPAGGLTARVCQLLGL
jgi:predicted nucleic acid-binding protein